MLKQIVFVSRSYAFCDNQDSLLRVLSQIHRIIVFLKCDVLVVPGSRCCIDHLCNDGFTFKSLNSIRISKVDQWKIDSNAFQMLMEGVRVILFKQKTFDFDKETCFNDEGFQSIVGLAKDIS